MRSASGPTGNTIGAGVCSAASITYRLRERVQATVLHIALSAVAKVSNSAP